MEIAILPFLLELQVFFSIVLHDRKMIKAVQFLQSEVNVSVLTGSPFKVNSISQMKCGIQNI